MLWSRWSLWFEIILITGEAVGGGCTSLNQFCGALRCIYVLRGGLSSPQCVCVCVYMCILCVGKRELARLNKNPDTKLEMKYQNYKPTMLQRDTCCREPEGKKAFKRLEEIEITNGLKYKTSFSQASDVPKRRTVAQSGRAN